MSEDLVNTLPLPERLALSYAPKASRTATLCLLCLDQRLAAILRTGGEPIIAQMKLAWWRERLSEDPASWPEGEPLLALLRGWPGSVADLLPQVDGWERLLADRLGRSDIAAFADARGHAWQALGSAVAGARSDRAAHAAREWALVDLYLNLGGEEERALVHELAGESAFAPVALGKPLRPLAVLHALSRRALHTGGDTLLDSPRAGLLALRVGITGR